LAAELVEALAEARELEKAQSLVPRTALDLALRMGKKKGWAWAAASAAVKVVGWAAVWAKASVVALERGSVMWSGERKGRSLGS